MTSCSTGFRIQQTRRRTRKTPYDGCVEKARHYQTSVTPGRIRKRKKKHGRGQRCTYITAQRDCFPTRLLIGGAGHCDLASHQPRIPSLMDRRPRKGESVPLVWSMSLVCRRSESELRSVRQTRVLADATRQHADCLHGATRDTIGLACRLLQE